MTREEYQQQVQRRLEARGPLTMITVRLPVGLSNELKLLAEHENISVNRLCVEILQGAVDGARTAEGWCP